MQTPMSLDQGRYSLTRWLGAGGMAEVHECYDHELDAWRAVKLLLPEYAQHPVIRRRFENEGKSLSQIDHPHVVQVYDVGEDSGRLYLVMEIARGGSLNHYLEQHLRMPPRQAVEVIRAVAEGVGEAHEHGIIHRDLKPDNILVSEKGICKVTDFGIAQVTTVPGGGGTQTGVSMGTVGYMAPEQRNDASKVSITADIYGLGATLFTLVTGDTPGDLFMSHDKPRLLKPLPQPLRPVIQKATAYDPEDRYPDTQAFRDALAQVAYHLPPKPIDAPSLVVELFDESPIPQQFVPPNRESATQPLRTTGGAEETLLDHTMAPANSTLIAEDAATGRTTGSKDPLARVKKAATPKPIPYRMPGQNLQASSNPDYIDEDAPSQQERKRAALERLAALKRRGDGPDPDAVLENTPRAAPPRGDVAPSTLPGEAPHTPEPEERRTLTGTPAPAKQHAPDRLVAGLAGMGDGAVQEVVRLFIQFIVGPIKPLLLPIILVVLLVGFASANGAWKVRTAATEAKQARVDYITTIDEEQRLIEDLAAMGAQAAIVEVSLARFRAAEDDEKLEAADEYILAIHEQMRRFGANPPPSAVERANTAASRLKRIEAARDAYEQRTREWKKISSGSVGAMACSLRIASCPE